LSDPREVFDRLIEAPKKLAGNAAWAPGPRSGQYRWLAALEIDGEVSELTLVVDTYPRSEKLKFSISLICGAALVRLDYWEFDKHLNHRIAGVRTPDTVELGWLEGSHIHGWPENRILVKTEPPKELEFAIPLPSNIQGFANSFRWFCGEHRIDIGSMGSPDLPARDTLL
jgi:hypothetical protein